MNRPYTGVPSLQGLLLLGLIIFGAYKVFSFVDTHDWPEVTGKVTGTNIQENYQRRRYGSYYSYTPVIQYVYLVDHASHEGQANLKTFGSRNEAIDFAATAYPKGMHLQVLYNPQHPNFSSLHRSAI